MKEVASMKEIAEMPSLEEKRIVTLLYPLPLYDLKNYRSTSKLLLGGIFSKPLLDAEKICQVVIQDNLEYQGMQVYLSLREFLKEAKLKNFDFSNFSLNLLTLPVKDINYGRDVFSNDLVYNLGEKIILKNFQMQYSVVFTSKQEQVHLITPVYQPLYKAIEKSSVTEVLKEIKVICQPVEPNSEKDRFLKNLECKLPKNLLFFYKTLNDYSFTHIDDELLTHGILNIMALSPTFIKSLPNFRQGYLKELQFSKILPMPKVILEIITQYFIGEEQDIIERRALVF